MKIATTFNGGIVLSLKPETDDDRLVLEAIKTKTVKKITVDGDGDGSLTAVNLHLEK